MKRNKGNSEWKKINLLIALMTSLIITTIMSHIYAMRPVSDIDIPIDLSESTTNQESISMNLDQEFVKDNDINLSTEVMNYTDNIDVMANGFSYIGKYDITGYTPKCVHCCGNDKGITASGTVATRGRTVATYGNIPFGTTLYIKGYGFYKVEDRGAFKEDTIDIACSTHEECYDITSNSVDVYIVYDDSFISY